MKLFQKSIHKTSIQSSAIRSFQYSLVAVILVVAGGAGGFYLIEIYSVQHGWLSVEDNFVENRPILEALYWAIETLTTTGYGDIVPKTYVGKIFVTVFSVLGLLTLAWAGANALAFIVEGRLSEAVREMKMAKEIHSLKDHYIICGLGRVGMEVIRQFRTSHVDYVVIDQSKEALDAALEENELRIAGNTTSDDTLQAAQIETAKGLVACVPSDADNVFTILTAKGMNPDLFIITRAQQEASRNKLIRAGADRVVMPALMGGIRMASMALRPAIVEFLDHSFQMSGGREPMLLEQIPVVKGSVFAGKKLRETDIKSKTDVLILGIKMTNGEVLINPPSDHIIHHGDLLIGMGYHSHFQALRRHLGIPEEEA